MSGKSWLLFWVPFFCILSSSLHAAPLDGTASVVYQTSSYSFSNGDWARGFVRLNAGFSVPASGTVSFNVLPPIAGTINFNTSGKMTLEGDMILASNATLSSGGKIDGQGNVVFLNGNITVPAGAVLQFTSNTIIDGQGHEIVLTNGAPGGQLYINGPANTSLTLRNVTVRGVRDYSGVSAIRVGKNVGQTLVLENVKMHLADDFSWWDGKLEIKKNTDLYGIYTKDTWGAMQQTLFNYYSSEDCTITADSTLSVDMTLAFIYYPTDASNYHIKFSDTSARLFLNGCTLYVSQDIGLRLLKGHLIFDHRTILQSDGAIKTAQSIQFGDGKKQSNDVIMDVLPGAKIEFEDAYVRYLCRN